MYMITNFWNFPLQKLPSSIFSSSIQNVPCTQFSMYNYTFPLSIKGHEQNSYSFHIPFQALWTTGHEREFWEISPLGHKWKFHVSSHDSIDGSPHVSTTILTSKKWYHDFILFCMLPRQAWHCNTTGMCNASTMTIIERGGTPCSARWWHGIFLSQCLDAMCIFLLVRWLPTFSSSSYMDRHEPFIVEELT